MKKDRFFVYFLLAGALLFLILTGLQLSVEEALLRGSESSLWFRLFPRIRDVQAEWGTPALLALCRQIPVRGALLFLFAFYAMVCLSQPDTGDPEKRGGQVYWRMRFFFGLQLIYLPDLLTEISERAPWKAFYQPANGFSFFLPHFPPVWAMQYVVLGCFAIGAWFVLARWNWQDSYLWILALAMLLLWTLLLAVWFGFGKTDHTYASLYSGLWGSLFLFLMARFRPEQTALGHTVFQASIWGCYFFSGWEKIFLSGTDWLSASHLDVLCLHHSGWACDWRGRWPGLVLVLFALGWAFQLATALQMRYPFWGWINAGLALVFHLGTGLLLGVGGWQSPWIAMALLLIPLPAARPPGKPETSPLPGNRKAG